MSQSLQNLAYLLSNKAHLDMVKNQQTSQIPALSQLLGKRNQPYGTFSGSQEKMLDQNLAQTLQYYPSFNPIQQGSHFMKNNQIEGGHDNQAKDELIRKLQERISSIRTVNGGKRLRLNNAQTCSSASSTSMFKEAQQAIVPHSLNIIQPVSSYGEQFKNVNNLNQNIEVQPYQPQRQCNFDKLAFDQSKKDEIAKSRYMDKRKVAPFAKGVGTNSDDHGQLTINQSQLSEPQQQTQSSEELRLSILSQLPHLIGHQKSCDKEKPGCQFNAKLLQYFIQKEFIENSKSAPAETVKLPQEQISQKNCTAVPDQHIQCCHQNSSSIPKDDANVHQQPEQSDNIEKSCDEEEEQRATVMMVTKCPHTSRKHYAKNMCSSCYRKFGRNQNAWKCEHHDRLLYSMGMCQTCYLSDYHKRRTKIKRKAKQIKAKADKQAAKDGKTQESGDKQPNESLSCQSISSESIEKINQDIILEKNSNNTDEETKQEIGL